MKKILVMLLLVGTLFAQPVKLTNTATLTYTDTSTEIQQEGVKYYYYVTAYDGNNESVASNIISVIIPVTHQLHSVILHWNASDTNDVTYNVYRDTQIVIPRQPINVKTKVD